MTRKNAWPEHELKLLGTMTDTQVADKTGRGKSAVAQMRIRLKIAPFVEKRSSFRALAGYCLDQWQELSTLPQPEFFAALKKINPELTYKSLAEQCFVSHSRVQKWFSPSGQEKLSLQMRHHMMLSVFINQKETSK